MRRYRHLFTKKSLPNFCNATFYMKNQYMGQAATWWSI